MNSLCKGCIVGIAGYCSIPDEYKEECPCVNCLIRITCIDECKERKSHYINSIRKHFNINKNHSDKIGLHLRGILEGRNRLKWGREIRNIFKGQIEVFRKHGWMDK